METYVCKSCDILYKIDSTNTSSDKQMNYCPICKRKFDIGNSMTNFSNYEGDAMATITAHVNKHPKTSKSKRKKKESENMKTKVREFLYQGKKMTSQEAYDDGAFDDILKELGVSEESVKLVVDINGDSLETYNNILYAATGYNDLEQINE